MFSRRARRHRLGLALTTLGALAACGGGGGATSTLSVGLVDTPSSRSGVQSVFVTVTGVEVQPAHGSALTFSLASPRTVDLSTLQQGNIAALVNNVPVPAGDYQWIRLLLDTSAGRNFVLACPAGTATTCPSPTHVALTIPSGAESGLKVGRGFTLTANGAIHLVIDFNVDRSIVPVPNSTTWKMKPVLRVVQTDTVGSIAGRISASVMQAAKVRSQACGAANLPTVYVYAAQSATTNVTPDDIYTGTGEAGDLPVQPIVTQPTTYNAADGAASFKVQWLASESGHNQYTVAFTCDPDDPSVDETAIVSPATTPTIFFATYATPVTVTTGATTPVNF